MRERENQPQVRKNEYNTTKKAKKKKKNSPNRQEKLIKTFQIIYIYIYCMLNRVLHDAATSHQTNPMLDESMKVEVQRGSEFKFF